MTNDLDALAASEAQDVRARAQIVLDTLRVGPSESARINNVTRQTAARWTALYRQYGVTRLQGMPASGHPDELRQAVLTAPLWMPTSKWSSRSIAESVGVSQSYVARLWSAGSAPRELDFALQQLVDDQGPTLVGVLVSADVAILAFELCGPDSEEPLRPIRTPRATTSALRTVLAAEMIRDRVPASAGSAPTEDFWSKLRGVTDPASKIVALTSTATELPDWVTSSQTRASAESWSALVGPLSGWRSFSTHPALDALQRDLRSWANSPAQDFSWFWQRHPQPLWRPTRPGMRSARPQDSPRTPVEAIVTTLRDAIVEGRFIGGDRVTERYLAQRLDMTRPEVHAALRTLEVSGLVTIGSGKAVVVPIPTVADVIETYAARRALGALAIRALARSKARDRRVVEEALEVLEHHAQRSDVYRTGQADLDFQDAIAEASGMIRIESMLRSLTGQLRMFIAVMGLRYAYEIDSIVRDNRLLCEAIISGDQDTAIERWRIKIDDAVRYMVGHLPPEHTQPTHHGP